jgi:hypothetical protein
MSVQLVTKERCQGWAERTKLTIAALDQDLLGSIQDEVLGRLGSIADVTTWITPTTTPTIVQVIISKMYMAWQYDRQYSEDIEGGNNYADRLKMNAEMLMIGLLDGTIGLPGLPDIAGSPVFYPTDASSAQAPTDLDPSLGPAAFSMGMRF